MRSLAQVFKALSDETRLTIIGLVFRHGQLCVCEVEQILGITQSKASRHLRYLRAAGVLEDERDGLIVNYRVPDAPDPAVAAVLVTLRELLASRQLPEARQLLVQIRSARSEIREAGMAQAPGVLVSTGSAGGAG
jgi:ArsR family transcriptional regulator